MLVTKPDDLIWAGWQQVSRARDINIDGYTTRYRLNPKYNDQYVEFSTAFDKIWTEGRWTLYIDELYYIQHLGLEHRVVQMLTQGRSKLISVVCGVQRPSRVTRFAMSEPTHIISGVVGDQRDVKTLSEMVGQNYMESVQRLDWFEFLYLNKRTRELCKVDRDHVEEKFSLT